MSTQQPRSPRLATLTAALASGTSTALDQFWQTVRQDGTPVIEPSDTDPDFRLVTFLWRAAQPVDNVVLISPLAYGWWWKHFTESTLLPIPTTDVYYRTYHLRADARFIYRLSPNDALIHPGDVEDWETRTATWQTDPLNPQTYVGSDAVAWSIVELPAAPPQPWSTPRPASAAGRVEVHRLRSDVLDNERTIWIYTPPGYAPAHAPYPLLVLFDGQYYTGSIPTATILDNLVAANLIPPMVTVMIDSLDRDQELTCSIPMCEFLTQELLPWIWQHVHVTRDPQRTTIGGISYGGLAAAFAGLRHADVFGNVLSQSGSFYWRPEDDPEDEWLIRQYAASPTLPLRFYLEVGLLENSVGPFPTNLGANRHFRTVLQLKGYEVAYAEFHGGHEMLSWRGTLANGLLALSGSDAGAERSWS